MPSTKDQGAVLEQIVAWLHKSPGVTVQSNVRLPVLGSKRAGREFDVLISSHVAGHEVQLAVECKNEAKPISAPRIDAFRGKLEAVGIPPSLGIYVSASGYTRGALDAARAAGIRPLIMEGLSPDRLSIEVLEAFQSVVVLLPDVVRVWLANGLTEPIGDVNEAFLFYDEYGQPTGTVQDFVWQAWRTGDLKPEVGSSVLLLEIPEGWHNLISGQRQPIRRISVVVDILALVMTWKGEARRSALVSGNDGKIALLGVEGNFERPSGRYELKPFRTGEELQEYLSSHGLVHVARAVKSPRIRFWSTMFWPPSQRVADIMATQMRLFDEGRIADPRPFSFQQIEGSDLGAAFEPIASDYLAGLVHRERGGVREGDELWQSA